MKIADLIPDDEGKMIVYRWPDSDEFALGRITRWDEHFIYVQFETSFERFSEEERACSPQFIRLLQGQL